MELEPTDKSKYVKNKRLEKLKLPTTTFVAEEVNQARGIKTIYEKHIPKDSNNYVVRTRQDESLTGNIQRKVEETTMFFAKKRSGQVGETKDYSYSISETKIGSISLFAIFFEFEENPHRDQLTLYLESKSSDFKRLKAEYLEDGNLDFFQLDYNPNGSEEENLEQAPENEFLELVKLFQFEGEKLFTNPARKLLLFALSGDKDLEPDLSGELKESLGKSIKRFGKENIVNTYGRVAEKVFNEIAIAKVKLGDLWLEADKIKPLLPWLTIRIVEHLPDNFPSIPEEEKDKMLKKSFNRTVSSLLARYNYYLKNANNFFVNFTFDQDKPDTFTLTVKENEEKELYSSKFKYGEPCTYDVHAYILKEDREKGIVKLRIITRGRKNQKEEEFTFARKIKRDQFKTLAISEYVENWERGLDLAEADYQLIA